MLSLGLYRWPRSKIRAPALIESTFPDAKRQIRESILPIVASWNNGFILDLRRGQVFDFDAVAVFDDLGDPAPVAMLMIALIAENADRAGFLHQRRQLVEFFPGL